VPDPQIDISRVVLHQTKIGARRRLGPALANSLTTETHRDLYCKANGDLVEEMVAEITGYVLTQRLLEDPVIFTVNHHGETFHDEYDSGWQHLKNDLVRAPLLAAKRPHSLLNRLRRAYLAHRPVRQHQVRQQVRLSKQVEFRREAFFPDANLLQPLTDQRLGKPVIVESYQVRP
jgi:hypothetical protein